MNELIEKIKYQGVTNLIKVDCTSELANLQSYIYDLSHHLLIDHDSSLTLLDKLQVPFKEPMKTKDWSTLMREVNDSPDSPLKKLVDSAAIVEVFEKLFGSKPEKFPICAFRAAVASNQRAHYDWHQDQGTWYVTKMKKLARQMPYTFWFSVNGADSSCSVEFALKSHHLKLLFHSFVEGQGAFQANIGKDIGKFEKFIIDAQAGEGILFHPLTLHRTIVPLTLRPRYSIDIRYSNPNGNHWHNVQLRFLLKRLIA